MKIMFFAAGLMSVCAVSIVSAQEVDSMKVIEIKKVEVTSTRASEKTPVAFTLVTNEQIAKVNFGLDLPFLLLTTPSVVATSDAGNGMGYTGVRIRGTDPSRINVTANGIPMNDPESHTVFWVNTPDFVSSVEDIQVQRGVGTSTNGAGAFGGSINIRTDNLRLDPYVEVSTSYGSFNTHRQSVKLGTGAIGNWAFDGRLSNMGSDGYVRRASVDLDSYFLQAGYYGRTTVVRFLNFTGKEKTYHAWNGITKEKVDTDRRYNECGEILGDDGETFEGYYKEQIDNYTQKNFQLLLAQKLSDSFSLNLSLHYTDGYGYYQEYKNGQSLVAYGLLPFEANGTQIDATNLVRRKIMDNWFGGGVFSLDYKSTKLQSSLGGAANRYDGDHFGHVIWVKNYVGQLRSDQQYYKNRGLKDDANIYWKANYAATSKLNIYTDMQYRRIEYSMQGQGDKWDYNNTHMQPMNIEKCYNFLNPKVGLFYSPNGQNNVFISFAVAHKEPTRNDFKDAKPGIMPKSERLFDYEAGWNYRSHIVSLGLNLYYMSYMNQLVQTGELNDIGEPLAKNMADSYRTGVEFSTTIRLAHWLKWSGNATLSKNIIKDYTEYLDYYDENGDYAPDTEYIGNSTIAFSPSFIAGSLFSFDHKGWSGALQSNYVGRQYMSNSMSTEGELDQYFVSNLRVAYTFEPRFMRSATVGAMVNNLFNAKYCSNGFAGRYMYMDGEQKVRESWAVYFPQATTNILINLTMKF